MDKKEYYESLANSLREQACSLREQAKAVDDQADLYDELAKQEEAKER